MKKILFLLTLISSNQFLTGQIILGVDDTPFNLVINGFYKAETANLGGDGPNQFWDYSDMDTTPTYQHIVKLHYSNNIPYSNLFPEADFVYRTHALNLISSDTTWLFYKTNPTNTELVGQFSQNQNEVCDYSNFELARPIPFQYLDSVTDTFESNCPYSTYNIHKEGNVKIKYDAFGTLKLPHGTFNNVGRVKTVKEQIATSTSGGITVVTNYKLTSYTYVLNSSIGIYTIAYIDVLGTSAGIPFSLPTDTSGTFSIFDLETLNSIENTSSSLSIYPNPCTDHITFTGETNFKSFAIIDLSGRIVASDLIKNTINIETSNLQQGSYYLILNDGEKLTKQQFIKQ